MKWEQWEYHLERMKTPEWRQWFKKTLSKTQSWSMPKIAITPKMQRWAKDKAKVHVKGKRFDKNIDKRDSVYLGYLGDAVFQAAFPEALYCDVSDYDFLLNGKTTDVKSWWTNYPPKKDYFVQIPVVDLDRNPDNYAFICLNTNTLTGWLVGWIEADQFKNSAKLKKQGESRDSAIVYTADCFEFCVYQLNRF